MSTDAAKFLLVPLDDDARRRAAETKRRRTRLAIEQATFDLLQTQSTVTFAEVAEESGVSVATIYRYYKNLNELVAGAFEHTVRLLYTAHDTKVPEAARWIVRSLFPTTPSSLLALVQQFLNERVNDGNREAVALAVLETLQNG